MSREAMFYMGRQDKYGSVSKIHEFMSVQCLFMRVLRRD